MATAPKPKKKSGKGTPPTDAGPTFELESEIANEKAKTPSSENVGLNFRVHPAVAHKFRVAAAMAGMKQNAFLAYLLDNHVKNIEDEKVVNMLKLGN